MNSNHLNLVQQSTKKLAKMQCICATLGILTFYGCACENEMMQPESKRIHTLNIEHQQSGNYKVTIQKRRRITKKEANSMKIKKKK